MRIGLIIVLLILPMLSNAQVIHQFGVQTGITYSNQTWEYDATFLATNEHGYIPGIQGGLVVQSRIVDRLYLQWGKGMSMKGFRDVVTFQPSGLKFEQTTVINNYIYYGTAHAAAQLRFPKEKRTFYLTGAFRWDYKIGRRTHYLYDTHFDNFEAYYPNLYYGTGITQQFGKLEGYLELVHNPDLWPAFKDPALRIYHNNIELRVGILLPGEWLRQAFIHPKAP